MEAFSEFHLRLTLLDASLSKSIVLVTEQVIREKTVKHGMDDERPSYWQTSWVVGAGMNEVYAV